MPELHALTNFLFRGRFYRTTEVPEDNRITVSEEVLLEEKAKGKHPKTKKWMSPLFNHCKPADAAAAEIFGTKRKPKAKPAADDENAVEALRAEFDAIGKAYDRRWREAKLKTELQKAKRAG